MCGETLGLKLPFCPLVAILINLCTIHIRHITMVTRMFRKCLNSWHSRAYYSSAHSEPILWSWWRGMGKSLLWSGLWWSPLTPAAPSGRQTPLHSTSHRSHGFTSLIHVCLRQIMCVSHRIYCSFTTPTLSCCSAPGEKLDIWSTNFNLYSSAVKNDCVWHS